MGRGAINVMATSVGVEEMRRREKPRKMELIRDKKSSGA